jgi:hypothetical protein
MNLTSDLPTNALRKPISLDSLAKQEDLNIPPTQALEEELLGEPNNGQSATQTHSLDQSGTFKHNGGSTSLPFKKLPFPLLLNQPPLYISKEHFNARQKWEGFVIEVKKDTFIARLTPIIGQGPDQETEIYLDEIEPEDQSLIQPGAIFYWSIGYLDRPSGRRRVSIIRFRRLPTWTTKEREIAKAKAAELETFLDGK